LEEYANPVISWLDGSRNLFFARLFRQDCIEKEDIFYKDLTLVNKNLSKICLIDNSLTGFALQPLNAIPIVSWFGEAEDIALLNLLPFLDALRFTTDIRSVLHLRNVKGSH
jgi:CTD nuclear envelope phosphatase 1